MKPKGIFNTLLNRNFILQRIFKNYIKITFLLFQIQRYILSTVLFWAVLAETSGTQKPRTEFLL